MNNYNNNLKNDSSNITNNKSLNKVLNILEQMENHTSELRKSIISVVRDMLIKNKNKNIGNIGNSR